MSELLCDLSKAPTMVIFFFNAELRFLTLKRENYKGYCLQATPWDNPSCEQSVYLNIGCLWCAFVL